MNLEAREISAVFFRSGSDGSKLSVYKWILPTPWSICHCPATIRYTYKYTQTSPIFLLRTHHWHSERALAYNTRPPPSSSLHSCTAHTCSRPQAERLSSESKTSRSFPDPRLYGPRSGMSRGRTVRFRRSRIGSETKIGLSRADAEARFLSRLGHDYYGRSSSPKSAFPVIPNPPLPPYHHHHHSGGTTIIVGTAPSLQQPTTIPSRGARARQGRHGQAGRARVYVSAGAEDTAYPEGREARRLSSSLAASSRRFSYFLLLLCIPVCRRARARCLPPKSARYEARFTRPRIVTVWYSFSFRI